MTGLLSNTPPALGGLVAACPPVQEALAWCQGEVRGWFCARSPRVTVFVGARVSIANGTFP